MLAALRLPRLALREPGLVVRTLSTGLRVVDESRVALPLGGSKVRNLEWLIGEACAGGGDVITLGPAGGQHLLASGVYGKRAGLRVHAVAWPQPWSEAAERSLRALHAHAEVVWPAASRNRAPFTLARVFATVRLLAGYPPMIWPPGGSSPTGVLGWVQGGIEIAESIQNGELQGVERIYVPLGSGGLAAGLRIGLALGGSTAAVVAVDVTGVGRLAVEAVGFGTRRLLARHGVRVEKLAPITVIREQSAYGEPTAAGSKASELATSAGLFVDATYGAKALSAALQDHEPGTAAFVATANAHPLDPLLASALHELPERLRPLLPK